MWHNTFFLPGVWPGEATLKTLLATPESEGGRFSTGELSESEGEINHCYVKLLVILIENLRCVLMCVSYVLTLWQFPPGRFFIYSQLFMTIWSSK